MSSKRLGIRLHYDIDASAQRGASVGNPLFDLLAAVHEHGSIIAAAKALGLSYRHVWGSFKRWEDVLGQPLLNWTQGQPARLTPFADRLLWAETRARARLVPHIEALREELSRVFDEAFEGDHQVLTLFASHDLALPALRELARDTHRLHVELRFCGSVDALQALAEGRCLVAGFHVPVLADGSPLFAAAMKPRLHPGRHKLIGCVRRTQGLMVARGNPLALQGVADLARPGLRFLNRQPGSGTRLVLEHLLQAAGIAPTAIAGWDGEPEHSHLAVAAAVAAGVADAAPGIEAAAREFRLDFVPLVEEDYFLVCLKDVLEHPAVERLRDVLASRPWQRAAAQLPGYALAPGIGQVLSLTKALPWWEFTRPKKGRAAAKG